MDLLTYINSRRGNAKALAERLGVSLSYLSQMASKKVPISPARCVEIEQITESAVTRRELRPVDWWLNWPELVTQEFPVPSIEEPANA